MSAEPQLRMASCLSLAKSDSIVRCASLESKMRSLQISGAPADDKCLFQAAHGTQGSGHCQDSEAHTLGFKMLQISASLVPLAWVWGVD